MLGLLIVLLLAGLTLSVLLWVGTVYLQGYFYTEPNPDAYWQAPAAGGALTVFLLVWCVLNVNSTQDQGVPYDTLFHFSAEESWDVRPADRIWAIRADAKEPILYLRKLSGRTDYENPVTKERLGSMAGVQAILVEDKTAKIGEKGAKIRFDRNKNADSGSNQFVSADGWSMGTDNLGLPSKFRFGLFLANLLINFLHFALWFVCLWLLLRFQWAHALGLAIVLWLVMTLTMLPMLMSRSAEIARPQPVPSSVTCSPLQYCIRVL